MVLWWIGNLLLLAAVLLAAALAHRVLVQALVIRRYAEDIGLHGGGLAAALEPVTALADTRQLAAAVTGAGAAYAERLRTRPVA